MNLTLRLPIDYERVNAENGNGRLTFRITVADDTTDDPITAEVTVEVNNMNDNAPIFIDKNGDEISRLDFYFNGLGKL